MAYTDKAYFLTKIKEDKLNNLLKDKDGAVQETYLDEAVKAADDVINGYLRSVIKVVPLTVAPDSIKECSYNIALKILHARIQYNDIPEWVRGNFKDSIDYLKDISAGKVTLVVTDDTDKENEESQISHIVDPPIFNRNTF